MSLACVGSAHRAWATLGLPQFVAAVLSRSTLLRLQVALQGAVHSGPCVSCPSQVSARVQVLGYSIRAQTWFGMHFVPFPGQSSSGDQVPGERTVPEGSYILITSPVQADGFPGCALREPSQECRVSPLGS